MSCTRYEGLLHLYRPGERTDGENLELGRHLAKCPRCSALKARIEKAAPDIERLRAFTPAPPDVETALTEIQIRLRDRPGEDRRSFLGDLFDRVLLIFDFPSMRYASAFLVAVVVVGYCVQQMNILSDVSALQDRLAGAGGSGPRLEVAYAVKPASPALAEEAGKALRSVAMADRIDRSGEIVLSRSDLENLRMMVARPVLSVLHNRRVLGLDRATVDLIVRSATTNLTLILKTEEKGEFR